MVVEQIVLAGAAGSVTLRNTSAEAVDLAGWFLCQRPAYWPLPSLVLGADQALTVHMGDGEHSESDVFAAGGLGSLGGDGEMGILLDDRFDSVRGMVHYVAWGGGGGRLNQARSAGIWGNDLIAAAEGDVIRLTGEPLEACGFEVEAGAAAALATGPATAAPGPMGVAIVEVAIMGAESSLVLQNSSAAPACLEGWFICNIPDYWPFPAGFELGPGETVRIDLSGGGSAPLSADGALGTFGDQGEAALYLDSGFGNSDSIVSYVAWRGGKGRKGVAQAAGIWGDSDVDAGSGDVIVRIGAGDGADAWAIQ